MPQPEFTSAPERRELVAALIWLPVHVVLLPALLGKLLEAGYITALSANLLCYGLGALYMTVFMFRFLRRDFDPLCDRPVYIIIQVAGSYVAMLFFNAAVSTVLLLAVGEMNPNNTAVIGLADKNSGVVTAMAVFLAPITEECLFRGAVFNPLRTRSRALAYAVSILLFSVYHVWRYASADPVYWLYAIQYIPVSWLLCRCYEQTNSIWTPIFFHMLTNGISLKLAEELL